MKVLCDATDCIHNVQLEEEEYANPPRDKPYPWQAYRNACTRDVIGLRLNTDGKPECFVKAVKHVEGHVDPTRMMGSSGINHYDSMEKAKKAQQQQRNRAAGIPNFHKGVELP